MADLEYADANGSNPQATTAPVADGDLVADGLIDTTGIDVAAVPVALPDGPPIEVGVAPAAPAVVIQAVPDLEPETAGEVNVPAPSAPSNTFAASVHGRTGAVVANVGDYTDAQVTNTSDVAGATVKAALNELLEAATDPALRDSNGDAVAEVAADGIDLKAGMVLKVDGVQVIGAQQAALTPQLTTITHTAPVTPDYTVQALTETGGFGFKTADEGHSVLAVIANLQTRLAELEARLEAHGAIATPAP